MITNVPTSDDLNAEALELLNLAWDMVATLQYDLHEMRDFVAAGEDDESPRRQEETDERFWRAARRHLTTALSLTQQAAEFGLKAKVAAVSPFLLLADPGLGAKAEAVDFSTLRTVDAQDLPKVHDAITAPPMDVGFRQRFSDLRAMRNRVMHTVSADVPVAVRDTLEAILYVHSQLFPARKWPATREEMITTSPQALLADNLFEQRSVAYREIALATEVLSRAQVALYFDIDKRARRYKCPECLQQSDRDFPLYGHLSSLRESADGGHTVYCPICDATHAVMRQDCEDGCGCTVAAPDGTCLQCWRDDA